MSDKSLSSKGEVEQYGDIATNLGDRQSLLLSAYLDEKTKWDAQRDAIRQEINELILKLNSTQEKCDNEFKVTRFIYNALLNKPTPNEVKLQLINSLLDELRIKMVTLANNEPNVDRYELAVFGSGLFKPR